MSPLNNAMIPVEIAYASCKQQTVLSLTVAPNSPVLQVIEQSGILQRFPEIDLTTMTVGIFSRRVKLTDHVQAGDRVEIYRPLLIDPKQKRRSKAQQR